MRRANLPAICAVAGLLTLWQAACSIGLVPEFLLPSPLDVAKAFVTELPLLWENSLITLQEAFLGLCLGVVMACAARWFCATLAGVVFWGDSTNGAWAAIVYSVGYNASYMVPECIICAALGLLMGKRLTAELRKVK